MASAYIRWSSIMVRHLSLFERRASVVSGLEFSRVGKGNAEACIKRRAGGLQSRLFQRRQKKEEEEKKSASMLSKLGQTFNAAGIVSAAQVLLREPEIALPHVVVPDIRSVDWHALRLSGFQGVVLDKDNTITAPYVQCIWPSLAGSLEECKQAFDGHVALLSNSAGLYQYDHDGLEAAVLEEALKISVIRHVSKKPSGSRGELEQHFGCDASLLIMVGDRYFTDIVYGNRNGLLTVITKPLTFEGEPFVVKQVRVLEEFLVQRWQQKGVLPVKHKLLSSSNKFVKDPVRVQS